MTDAPTRNTQCTVIDAGARYGLHPTWASLRNLVDFHLFEADHDEASRLAGKYQSQRNISVHALALFNQKTELELNRRHHNALNSIYAVDTQFLERENYMVEEFETSDTVKVPAATIDSLFPDEPIHFLKLDIEGAELCALEGAQNQLHTNILGVRSEVTFAPLFHGGPAFGDIQALMLDHGFELLNLDYVGKGVPRGPFTMPDRFGRLLSSDAVWVVPPSRVLDQKGDRLRDDTIRLAIFCMLNNATDVAIDLLLQATRDCGVDFTSSSNDPLFRELHKSVALLFKSIGYLPSIQSSDVSAAYTQIFGRQFPSLHEFYQSDIFA